MLRWTLGCTCLFQIWFPRCACPAVILLGHTAVLFPVFEGISTLFSIAAVLVCIPTNSVRGFAFLHTPSSIIACRLLYSSHPDWRYTLNLYNAVCQLYLNKTGRKRKKRNNYLQNMVPCLTHSRCQLCQKLFVSLHLSPGTFVSRAERERSVIRPHNEQGPAVVNASAFKMPWWHTGTKQIYTMVKQMGSGLQLPMFFWLCHLLAVWPRPSYFTSLSLSFLIYM